MLRNHEPANYSTQSSAEQKAHILVVEDDKRWMERLSELFLDMGCDVDKSSTYQDARNKLRTTRYDLVSIDLGLSDPPEIHEGLLLLDATTLYKIPSIVVTGLPTTSQVLEEREKGREAREKAREIVRSFPVIEVFLKDSFNVGLFIDIVQEALETKLTVAPSKSKVKRTARVKRKSKKNADILIISNRAQLARYGDPALEAFEKEIELYMDSLSSDSLESELLYIDEAGGPDLFSDAKNISEFLAHYLRKRKLGYLLIIGGPQTIPFHSIRDQNRDDIFIYSDEPYGKVISGQDIAVGRMPEGTDNFINFITRQLRVAAELHSQKHLNPKLPSVAFSAAAWKEMSERTFPEMELTLCPPHVLKYDAGYPGQKIEIDDSIINNKATIFFNVHGVERGPYWYGEDTIDGETYLPTMFSPAMVAEIDAQSMVVFTEACFGAHILGKRVDDSIALRYIQAGCPAFIGSTATVYGSIDNITNGDLLAKSFLEHLNSGERIGDAFKKAKKQVDNSNTLLGEKTVLEFVLFGDPTIKF